MTSPFREKRIYIRGNDMKTSRITIRLSDDEADRIRGRAADAGISIADYIRQSSLRSNVVSAELLRETKKEINRIGANINQLVRYCHREQGIDYQVIDALRNKILELDKVKEMLLRR
jgi:hypothetical protein